VSLRFIARAIDEGLRLEPDLVCLTGDFITWTYEAFAEYAAVLARLAAVAPTYACLGNHDGGEWARPRGGYPDTRQVRQLLRESRVELLDNAMTSVHPAGRKLTLIGLGDGWAGEFDPGRAFAEAPASGGWPRLVLSHNPDTKNLLLAFGWHLMLCGHTHGGQCELPLIGTPFAPVNDKRFVRGLQAWENRWIHITKGVGNVHGLRFNCRPEVSLLTLV
jgi:predicted MPP superfamily phosphohydrolase